MSDILIININYPLLIEINKKVDLTLKYVNILHLFIYVDEDYLVSKILT